MSDDAIGDRADWSSEVRVGDSGEREVHHRLMRTTVVASGADDGARPWRLLTLIAAARTAASVQFQAVGALGPVLMAADGLAPDYVEFGTLIGAYSLAGVIIALPSGWLMDRFGDRRALLAGLGLMTLGGLTLAAAPVFIVALLSRVVAGAGATLLSIASTKLVLDRFAFGAPLATAMGIVLATWPFGIGLALAVMPVFEQTSRIGLLVSALLCAIVLPPLSRAVPPTARAASPQSAPANSVSLRLKSRLLPCEWSPLLVVGLLWAVYNAGFTTALGFAPAFLVARGSGPAEAGALVSLVGWATLPILLFGGTLAERSGRPNLMAATCIAAMILVLSGLAAGTLPTTVALAAFGLLSAPPASLIMAMLGRVLSPESRPFGLGVYYTMFYVGMAGVPPLAGWARDVTGSVAAPLWAAVAALVVALAALAAATALIRRRSAPAPA